MIAWKPTSTGRIIISAGVTIQIVVLLVAWTLHRQNLRTLAPPQLVAQVLAPEDMVYSDSDVAAARGKRLPPIQVAAAMRPTAPQIAEGRTLFGQRCATCHGPQGHGDGPVGLTLSPRPRNLTALAGWKRGTRPSDIFTTVTLGLEGTQMSGFDYLPASQRFALTHYVASLATGRDADTPATLDALDRRFRLSEGSAAPNVEPLSVALQKLTTEAPAAPPTDPAHLRLVDAQEPAGAALFATAVAAGGDETVRWWLAADRTWIGNPERLRALALQSAPANGFASRAATLTAEDWRALERYLSLRVTGSDDWD